MLQQTIAVIESRGFSPVEHLASGATISAQLCRIARS